MNILIECNHYPVASGRYMYNALKRLGHDVKSRGISHDTVWGMAYDPAYAWVPDAPDKTWTPELVIHMDGNTPPAGKAKNALHVVYGVDNHVRDYWPDFAWDHLFLAHGHGSRMGESNVTHLPCGYDPTWFTPGPPLEDRSLDAAMIGVDYPQRAAQRYTLLNWLPRLSMSYGLALYEQYVAAYQNAKISLVRSANRDVAMRVWETAAMGCVIVMDEVPDCEALGLVHGENCLMYRTDDECAQRVKWVIENPAAAQDIASAGQAWALPGTWDARAQVIVQWAENQQEPKAKRRKATVESGDDDSD